MPSIQSRGYINKLELKETKAGAQIAKFELAVQQKRKDQTGQEVKETLYYRCVDFDPKNLPAEGDYVGVTGYVTMYLWSRNGKSGVNVDVTVKEYERLEQKPRAANARSGKPDADASPPSDPFKLAP